MKTKDELFFFGCGILCGLSIALILVGLVGALK